jgi:vitamin B12 transporter
MFKFDLGYTYTDSRYKADKDATDWTRKEYLPRNKVDLIVTLFPMDKLTMAVDIKWHDEQIVPLYDASYKKVRWEENSVTTVNLSTTYKVMQNMEFFARVDNLFDNDYTESGYCMPGVTLYGGVKFQF